TTFPARCLPTPLRAIAIRSGWPSCARSIRRSLRSSTCTSFATTIPPTNTPRLTLGSNVIPVSTSISSLPLLPGSIWWNASLAKSPPRSSGRAAFAASGLWSPTSSAFWIITISIPNPTAGRQTPNAFWKSSIAPGKPCWKRYTIPSMGHHTREGSLGNTREPLATMARSYPGATVVMEAGTHSPWVSRLLQELGLRVIVANPRKTRAIYQNERKSDRRDAMMLARLARMDLTLLHPVEHGSQEAQQDMLQLKLRDSLVRARVALINAVRFSLKSLGYPVSNPSGASFHKFVLKEVPESIGEMIAHNVAAIAELTQRIKALEVSISRLAAERYPETIYLQQVSGVGPITSLYFVLKVGNPGRFQ